MLTRTLLTTCLLATGSLAACGGDDGQERATSGQRAETAVVERERTTQTEPDATGAQSGRVRLVGVGRFAQPVSITAPRGDRRRLFVVEQGGRIRVVRGGRKLRRPFLDISRRVVSGGEQGLLGLAFAPDYARSRRFYVHYTNRSGDTRLVEYRRSRGNPDRAVASSARVVLRQNQPETNHNGGQIAFGPHRLLYMGLGDGGGANDRHGGRGNGQNLGTILGKILRIDPRRSGRRPYRIPAGNPFRGRDGARPEIFSYGLRNPWRFSFDRETGALAIGDVGQDAFEEVNYVSLDRARGANFGWRPFEGTRRLRRDEEAPGHVPPVLEYPREDPFCSVIGGYVVRDPALPALAGRYVYGDFCEGRLRSAVLRPGGAVGARRVDAPEVGSISTFGEDARGRVYVASLDGAVYRLAQG